MTIIEHPALSILQPLLRFTMSSSPTGRAILLACMSIIPEGSVPIPSHPHLNPGRLNSDERSTVLSDLGGLSDAEANRKKNSEEVGGRQDLASALSGRVANERSARMSFRPSNAHSPAVQVGR